MTIKEAWLSIADQPFLCNRIKNLYYWSHSITEKQYNHMLRQLKLVEKQIFAAGFDFTAYWDYGSPERVKFAKMAARGHAKDYVWKNTF